MKGTSRLVSSNQDGLHPRLDEVVRRHLSHDHLAPIAPHVRAVFEAMDGLVKDRQSPVILDCGCGTGDSTRWLAAAHRQHLVLGIDKSHSRLTRQREEEDPDNMALFRGDLFGLYPLLASADWDITANFLLYPNPWPKAAHLQRRFHGGPSFRHVLNVGKTLILRSNWLIYIKEFERALEISGIKSRLVQLGEGPAISPFEQKYRASGHDLWELAAELDKTGRKQVGG